MDEINTQQNVLFPRLNDVEIAALKRIGTTRYLRDGESLFEIGEPQAQFYVVLSGAVEMIDLAGDQPREHREHVRGAGGGPHSRGPPSRTPAGR